jgi:hypothetical protein
MANDLVKSVKAYLAPEVIEKINGLVGESASTIDKAMDGIVPSLLSEVADLSASSEGAKRLAEILNQRNHEGPLHNLPASLRRDNGIQNLMNFGRRILITLFGSRLNTVIDGIANSAGLKVTSVTSLLSITAPLVVAVLGREWGSEGLFLAGLVHPFTPEDRLSRIVPASLAALWPLGRETTREDRVSWWLWPALGLLAVALLYFLWERGDSLAPLWLAFVDSQSSRIT